MLALVLALFLTPVDVERVVAVVNGVPVLASDVELAQVAGLVPQGADDDAERQEETVVAALVALELRWQDLRAAALVERVNVDADAAWAEVVRRAGGEETLEDRLRARGLEASQLRHLVYRAAVVEAYVAARFAPFVRPTDGEVERMWAERLVPELQRTGKPVPDLSEVHAEVAALVREEKLIAEIERWTDELARRAEIVRYRR